MLSEAAQLAEYAIGAMIERGDVPIGRDTLRAAEEAMRDVAREITARAYRAHRRGMQAAAEEGALHAQDLGAHIRDEVADEIVSEWVPLLTYWGLRVSRLSIPNLPRAKR
jgi:hypothetical protein